MPDRCRNCWRVGDKNTVRNELAFHPDMQRRKLFPSGFSPGLGDRRVRELNMAIIAINGRFGIGWTATACSN
jgi:hypothetical protein